MARARTVKPAFFKDDDLYEAEVRAKLPLRIAYEGLWCVADREGRFEWKPRQLKTDVLPYDPVDFSDVLAALESAGFIARYVVNGRTYGYIPNLKRHQNFHKREAASTLPAPPAESSLGPDKAGPRPGLGPDKAGTSPADTDTDTDTESDTDTETEAEEGRAAGAIALREAMPLEYRPALDGALKAARNPDALLAEIGMITAGARGLPAPSLADVGLALHDLAISGGRITANALRAFVRSARDGAGQLRSPPGGAGSSDVIAKAEAIQAHHARLRASA